MQTDALGIYAQNGVYCANLFTMDAGYQLAAINLFTDYDGKGNGFGDTLVSCESDDIVRSTSYAAINGDDTDVITLVVTNKAYKKNTVANITLPEEYSYVHAYGINNMASTVFDLGDSNPAISISGNKITYEMAPKTVTMLVIAKDKSCLDKNEASQQDSTKKKEKSGISVPVVAGISVGVVAVLAGAVVIIKKKKPSVTQEK